jgi:iron complex outermembrane receptor protein
MFSVSSTATGCAVLLMAAASAATAADQAAATAAASADSGTIEEIVVTGIRKGIEDSIAAKKSNSSIIEVVSAEDIGKLPDSSIAESIARLPGIAAQRTNGRAQTMSIRGLGPDFTITTFNGREQASTNDNRTVEFDQYPSELVSQVKVFKTPNAGMSYQGIAGTTDIETVHPLAFGKRTLAATYRREKDNMSANVPGLPDSGNRASLTYIDQFMDHTVGVALGLAFTKSPYQAQTREPWGYPCLPATDGSCNGPGPYPPNTYVIGGDKDGVQSSFYERVGYLGVLEFKPSDSLHMTIDGYHSNFKELQTIRRMEFGTVWAGGTVLVPGPIVGGRMVSGTFNNVPFVVLENYNNDTHAKLDSLGWNTEYKLNDSWTVTGDLSWSKVKRNDVRLESTGGNGAGADPAFPPPHDTVTFTTEANGVTHLTTAGDYGNYNTSFLTDPGGWGGGPTRAGFLGSPTINDELKAIKLAADRKLGSVFSKVSFGVNYAERTKSKYLFQGMLQLPGGVSHLAVPDAYRTGIMDTSFFGNPNGMISYDALAMYHDGIITAIDARVNPTANSNDRTFDITNTWSVKEKLTTPYIRFEIDTQMGSVPVTGNIGVQAQRADQTANLARARVQGAQLLVYPYNDGNTYSDVLPSMNLSFALAHDVHLRAAAAVTVARPRMDEMAGGSSFSVVSDTGTPSVQGGVSYYWIQNGGGNPKLKPWKANSFDLAIEKYFSNKGYVSAAVYYKSLTSYIFNQSKVQDFTGYDLPIDPTLTYVNADTHRLGVSTVKSNGHGGTIKGLELSVSLPLDTFTPVLNGFGFIVSGAWNRSAVNPLGTKEIPVPGLSSKVINSTLYYEKYGFSARVSNRYRGTFLGEIHNFDSSLDYKNIKSESLVDAQVGYEFRNGPVKGLTLNLSGTNLTDAPFVQYNYGDTSYYPTKYEKYGAIYAFAISYKF